MVEVTQKALAQPGGRAGAVTESKFWVRSWSQMVGPGEAVGVTVGLGVAGGVVGVGEGVGAGVGRHATSGPSDGTRMGSPVLKNPTVTLAGIGGAVCWNRKL